MPRYILPQWKLKLQQLPVDRCRLEQAAFFGIEFSGQWPHPQLICQHCKPSVVPGYLLQKLQLLSPEDDVDAGYCLLVLTPQATCSSSTKALS